jgi:hypothetical protein
MAGELLAHLFFVAGLRFFFLMLGLFGTRQAFSNSSMLTGSRFRAFAMNERPSALGLTLLPYDILAAANILALRSKKSDPCRFVRLWPKADMTVCAAHVRFRM